MYVSAKFTSVACLAERASRQLASLYLCWHWTRIIHMVVPWEDPTCNVCESQLVPDFATKHLNIFF